LSQADNDDDGTSKSADELMEHYESNGITPHKEVIAYCGIGEIIAHLVRSQIPLITQM
jgi:3-mercaptopyruvate sulfurtransferase SseA